MKIILITQYYQTPKRKEEFEVCIKKNVENKQINELHFLNENKVDFIPQSEKINEKMIGKRLTFREIFEYANKEIGEGNIVIITNNDIFFVDDEKMEMIKELKENECITLARYDMKKTPERVEGHLVNLPYAQDAWIFKTPIKIPEECDFSQGTWGCDNRILWELFKTNYRIKNPSHELKAIHVHETNYRTAKEENRIYSAFYNICPGNQEIKYDESEDAVCEISGENKITNIVKTLRIKDIKDQVLRHQINLLMFKVVIFSDYVEELYQLVDYLNYTQIPYFFIDKIPSQLEKKYKIPAITDLEFMEAKKWERKNEGKIKWNCILTDYEEDEEMKIKEELGNMGYKEINYMSEINYEEMLKYDFTIKLSGKDNKRLREKCMEFMRKYGEKMNDSVVLVYFNHGTKELSTGLLRALSFFKLIRNENHVLYHSSYIISSEVIHHIYNSPFRYYENKNELMSGIGMAYTKGIIGYIE